MTLSLYTRACICLDSRLNCGEINIVEYWDRLMLISVFYKRRYFRQMGLI